MIVDSAAKSRDHSPDGSVSELIRPPEHATYPLVFTRLPEAPHSFENVDTIPHHLYRIEFKNHEFRNVPNLEEQAEKLGLR